MTSNNMDNAKLHTDEKRETNKGNGKKLKKIWVVAQGTRGDVQPYAAVGAALVKRGYEVVFMTQGKPSLLALAAGYGMRTVPLTENFELTDYHKFIEGMYKSDTKMILDGLVEANRDNAPYFCKAFLNEIETNGLPDLCVTMPLIIYLAWYLAINHQVPFAAAFTYSPYYDPNRATLGFPNLPFGLNKLIIRFVLPIIAHRQFPMYDKLVEKPILHKFTPFRFIKYLVTKKPQAIILQSPIVLDAMSPYIKIDNPNNKFVGTTVLDVQQQLSNDAAFGGIDLRNRIQAFIEKEGKTKPIYIGWGSMLCISPQYMATICAKAIFASKQRAIVFGGGGELQDLSFQTLQEAHDNGSILESEVLEYAKENLMFVGRVPHEWLLSQVAATVHHGGAGTTTAALRAGVPTIITPMIADQFDFSHAVNQLGVGIGFRSPLSKLNWHELGTAISRVVNDEEMSKNAALLGEKLRNENGVEGAVDAIEEYWKDECVTGKFLKEFLCGLEGDDNFVGRVTRSSLFVVGAIAVVVGCMKLRLLK